MTLDEVREQIDAIDTQMKPLFINRMGCSRQVAEAKSEMGSDSVFVLERELSIIEKRADGVDPAIYDEYVAFLRHLMSVSRRYQYGIMKDLQDKTLAAELEKSGLDEAQQHEQITITFSCVKDTSDLNLFVNMIKLNGVSIDRMDLRTEAGTQKVTIVLDGSLKESNMRQLLCQIAKESDDFQIIELR